LLYDSLLAGETESLRVRLSIESGDPEDEGEEASDGEGEFELVYTTTGESEEEQIETRTFRIVEEHGVTVFARQLKEATIATKGKVVLGTQVDDFEIGPSVDIRCRMIEIPSKGFVVRAGRAKSHESDGVVLEAAGCISNVSRKPLVRGSLVVSWPGAQAYPWSDFAAEAPEGAADGARMHEVLRRFRRIVTSLRSHKKGGLARFQDKVEHRRVLKNRVGRALLNQLLADGIIRLENKFYHWCPDRADALLRVSWDALRQRRVTPELNAYLSRFVEGHPELFES